MLMKTAEAASRTPMPPLDFTEHRLANGIRLLLLEDHHRPMAHLELWYHVGSKDEKPGTTGFAHLFEHLMFRGSRHVGPEQHMLYVRQAGGVVNAYTTFDQTVYWETFPSHYLERMLWLEADRLAALDVSESNFLREREVVKEERRMHYENQPYGLLAEDILDSTFTVYPYKHMPIGSMEDLDRASIDMVRDFHGRYYVPGNLTLILAGDFDTHEGIRLVDRHFGSLPPRADPIPRVSAIEPPQENLRELRKTYPMAPLPAVAGSFHLPPMGHPDSYALEIASVILSSGQSSRLYRRLVYETQSALSASGQAYLLEGPSIFFSFAICNYGRDAADLNRLMQEVFLEMKENPVSEEELLKAKNNVVRDFIIGRQTLEQRAGFLGKMAVLRNDPSLCQAELARYQEVTPADVQRVCRHYLIETNETRLWVEPGPPPPGEEGIPQ